MPNKDEMAWFIRPHHVESLTGHFQSIKDDFLNTRYFSHYNQQYGKVKEFSVNEIAIEQIEKHLDTLKLKQKVLAQQRNINLDNLDEIKAKIQRPAHLHFE